MRRLGALLALAPLAAGGGCVQEECRSACDDASGNSSACQGVVCSEEHGRCACAPAAALLWLDGSCQTASSPSSCAPTHDVLLNVGVWSCPELSQADVDANAPSEALLVILHEAVAAGLELPPEDVLVTEVEFAADFGDDAQGDASEEILGSGMPGSILHFDLQFSLCSSGAAALRPELDKAGFERRLGARAADFAAFQLSVIRLYSDSLEPREPFAQPETTPTPSPATAVGASDGDEGTSFMEQFWWLPFIGVLLAAAAALAAWLVFRERRRRRRKFSSQMSFESSVGVQEYSSKVKPAEDQSDFRWHEERYIARVAVPFDPRSQPDSCAACLELLIGDLVEVEAESGPEWLYGHNARAPSHAGVFPRQCVERLGSWQGDISRVPDPAPPPQVDTGVAVPQGKNMRITRPFSAEDVPTADAVQDHLMFLAGGEEVEVLNAADGWLYGRLLDGSAAGYFPEYCVVAAQAAAAEAPAQQSLRQSAAASRGLRVKRTVTLQRVGTRSVSLRDSDQPGRRAPAAAGSQGRRQLRQSVTGLSLCSDGGDQPQQGASSRSFGSLGRRPPRHALSGLSSVGLSSSLQRMSPAIGGAGSPVVEEEDAEAGAEGELPPSAGEAQTGADRGTADAEAASEPGRPLCDGDTKIHLASDPTLAADLEDAGEPAETPAAPQPPAPARRGLTRQLTSAIADALWGGETARAEQDSASPLSDPDGIRPTRSGGVPLRRALSRKVTTAISSAACAGPAPMDW